jgi:hypothetical protein
MTRSTLHRRRDQARRLDRSDKMVDALEKTDYVGTIGRIQFYGKDDPFTHG